MADPLTRAGVDGIDVGACPGLMLASRLSLSRRNAFMATRKQDFREGAVRLIRETNKPIARVARVLGMNVGTLGNWVNADRRRAEN